VQTAVLSIEGKNVNVGAGDFGYETSLKTGKHTASLYVRDTTGYESEDKMTFEVDNELPFVSLTRSWAFDWPGDLVVSDNVAIGSIVITVKGPNDAKKTLNYNGQNYPTRLYGTDIFPGAAFQAGSILDVDVAVEDTCGNKASTSGVMVVTFPTPTATATLPGATAEPGAGEPRKTQIAVAQVISEVKPPVIEARPSYTIIITTVYTLWDFRWLIVLLMGLVLLLFAISQLGDPRPPAWNRWAASRRRLFEDKKTSDI
jgi:hypothetical protein